jgi:hypothetical protein
MHATSPSLTPTLTLNLHLHPHLHRAFTPPSPKAEWSKRLAQSGLPAGGLLSVRHACASENGYLQTHCALWLLFHTLAAHASEVRRRRATEPPTPPHGTPHWPRPRGSFGLRFSLSFRLGFVHFGSGPGSGATLGLLPVRQARAGAVADTIAQFVSSFAACEDCAGADALLKEGGGRGAPAAARGSARHHAALWVWEQHNALSATLAARTAPATGASASHEACVLNVTANAGADIVQLSQLRLYGARGAPLEVGAARSPEWCHSAEPEGSDMVLDSSLSTKWLCRADHAELQLTLAAPAAVTGYELWSANDVPNRDPLQWELRCGTKIGGAAAGGAAGGATWLLHRGRAVKRAFGEAAPRKQSMGRVDIVPQRRGFKAQAPRPRWAVTHATPCRPAPSRAAPPC